MGDVIKEENGESRRLVLCIFGLCNPNILQGTKRKASEDPSSPSASKRIKHAESVEPAEEQKPMAMKPIPFPEKVGDLSQSSLSACLGQLTTP
jgi:hypothetical protein